MLRETKVETVDFSWVSPKLNGRAGVARNGVVIPQAMYAVSSHGSTN